MTMQSTATPTHDQPDDRLAWPDCVLCDKPMALRSISYTAQRQTVTFECAACFKRVAKECSVSSLQG